MATEFKVVVTGDSSVITQFMYGEYGEFVEGYDPTVSEQHLEKGFPPCLTQTKLISHIHVR